MTEHWTAWWRTGWIADIETALAIYEALIEANVPTLAARRVAESLERDMSANLATKQDLEPLRQGKLHLHDRMSALEHGFEVLENRFESLDRRFESRSAELEQRVALMIQNVESRLLIKLGTLMTVLLGAAGGLLALVR